MAHATPTRAARRAIAAQRAGKAKVLPPLEPPAPSGVGGAAPRASTRAPRWQDRASRKAQAAQLLREPYCEVCRDKGSVTEATEVDHRTPRHAGGSMTDPANLRSLCHNHHVEATLADRAQRTGKPVQRRRKTKIDPATGLPLPGQPWHWWSEPLPEKGK